MEKELEDSLAQSSRSILACRTQHEQSMQAMQLQYDNELADARRLATSLEKQYQHWQNEANQQFAKVQELQRSLGLSMNRSAELSKLQLSHESTLAQAVAEAKQKVYDKVKIQFDSGNKEFQKVIKFAHRFKHPKIII